MVSGAAVGPPVKASEAGRLSAAVAPGVRPASAFATWLGSTVVVGSLVSVSESGSGTVDAGGGTVVDGAVVDGPLGDGTVVEGPLGAVVVGAVVGGTTVVVGVVVVGGTVVGVVVVGVVVVGAVVVGGTVVVGAAAVVVVDEGDTHGSGEVTVPRSTLT